MGELIRTGRAAAILGTSRQHVVDLVTRGVLANHGHGVQRRLDREEVEAHAGRPRPREARLGLWLHYAIAGRIVRDPMRSMEDARRGIDALALASSSEGRSLQIVKRWRSLISGGPEAILRAITAESDVADRLREKSPLFDLLSDAEQRRLIRSFAAEERRFRMPWHRERDRAWPRRRPALLSGSVSSGAEPDEPFPPADLS